MCSFRWHGLSRMLHKPAIATPMFIDRFGRGAGADMCNKELAESCQFLNFAFSFLRSVHMRPKSIGVIRDKFEDIPNAAFKKLA